MGERIISGEGEDFYPRPPRSPFEPGDGWISPVEKMLVACIILLILCMVGFAAWTSEQVRQAKNETLDNRAVGCRLMRSLGIDVSGAAGDDPCASPAIKGYLKAHPEDITRINHDRALCAVAQTVGVPEKELEHLCGPKRAGG